MAGETIRRHIKRGENNSYPYRLLMVATVRQAILDKQTNRVKDNPKRALHRGDVFEHLRRPIL